MSALRPLDAALAALYPAFAALPAAQRTRLRAGMVEFEVPRGTRLFDAGTPCRGFPLVLEGSVRVARTHEDGRALELYRVSPGEICIVSTGCLMQGRPLSADGVAAEDTRIALLGREAFLDATADPQVRQFVFGVFAERMADLCELVEAVAFHRLDRRLAEMLLGHGRQVSASHQDLAQRLGTSREIVSRLISRFARDGWIRTGRESIEILDAAALRALGGGSPP